MKKKKKCVCSERDYIYYGGREGGGEQKIHCCESSLAVSGLSPGGSSVE